MNPDLPPPRGNGLVVTPAESGSKLVGFLERRLSLPANLLHRWIRTGQIRLNGCRVQPFARVASGDAVRLPPFAWTLSLQAKKAASNAELVRRGVPAVEILGEHEGIVAVFKPSGVPTHPGTKHRDSLITRLHIQGVGEGFTPTPIHRLDRDTSGVLLVAKTFAALRDTQEFFRERSGVRKEYLAWVRGTWGGEKVTVLRHWLSKRTVNGVEKMVASSVPGDGLEAVLAARPLAEVNRHSLMHVRLFTGRTHQIRVQLAAAGHPVLGDGKYGPSRDKGPLYLHSLRIVLPDGTAFAALPRWEEPFAVDRLPDPLEVEEGSLPM